MKRAGFYAGTWLLLGLLFLLFPAIDLAATGLFYVPGEGFPLAHWPPLVAVETAIPWITRIIVLIVAAGAVWLALMGRPLWRLDRKALVFLIVATALGPGLIANTVLKDNWGRARPYQTASFGGTRQFTPAPLPAAQCRRNCAFVSGHAALAFSVVSFAFLLPAGRRRRLAIGTALGFGMLVGIARIAAGAHFLSDVVLCRADRRRDELAALRGDRRTRPARQPGGVARLPGRRIRCRNCASGRRRAVFVAAGAADGMDRRGRARRDIGDLVDRPPARPVPALSFRMEATRRGDPASRFRDAVSRRVRHRVCRAALGRSAAAAAALGRRDARGRARPRLSAGLDRRLGGRGRSAQGSVRPHPPEAAVRRRHL